MLIKNSSLLEVHNPTLGSILFMPQNWTAYKVLWILMQKNRQTNSLYCVALASAMMFPWNSYCLFGSNPENLMYERQMAKIYSLTCM
jgi:hypothetical protein